MYIAGAHTVEFESWNVYRLSARGGMRVHECISLSVPIVECESKNVYC